MVGSPTSAVASPAVRFLVSVWAAPAAMQPPIVINVQISPSSTTAAATCASLATILTFMQVRDHLRLNPNNALRVHVNRILLMCPSMLSPLSCSGCCLCDTVCVGVVYAWTSFLSTTIGYSMYFDTCRDCYVSNFASSICFLCRRLKILQEAFVIYSFYKFMSIVLGGLDSMAVVLRSKQQQKHLFPFRVLPMPCCELRMF